MNTRLKHLATGRHRAVYLLTSGKYVIKIPIDDYGYSDNILEASRSKKDGWLLKEQMARCKLLRNGCLIMEYVRLPSEKEYNELPKWTDGVDCRQVGYTIDGRLVAYDYA